MIAITVGSGRVGYLNTGWIYRTQCSIAYVRSLLITQFLSSGGSDFMSSVTDGHSCPNASVNCVRCCTVTPLPRLTICINGTRRATARPRKLLTLPSSNLVYTFWRSPHRLKPPPPLRWRRPSQPGWWLHLWCLTYKNEVKRMNPKIQCLFTDAGLVKCSPFFFLCFFFFCVPPFLQ